MKKKLVLTAAVIAALSVVSCNAAFSVDPAERERLAAERERKYADRKSVV